MKPCLVSGWGRVNSFGPGSAICLGFDFGRSNPSVVQVLGGRRCDFFDLHNEVIPYNRALTWQKEMVRDKKDQDCPTADSLIVLQHDPVYTLGTGSSEDYLLFDPKAPPAPVHRTDRAGEVTYHGPGQLVMYPILNLRNHKKDLHWVLRCLEDIVIRTLRSTFFLKASRIPGLTGVWVGNQKLAAVAIAASRWISYHGLALNVTTDLTPFQWIVPCGIRDRDRKVGSVQGILYQTGTPHSEFELIDLTYKSLIKEFSQVFQLHLCYKSISSLT